MSRLKQAWVGALLMTCEFSGMPPQAAERARDLGIPFEGVPGALNAITDVHGVAVGHVTLVEGSGALKVGYGPVRTGVTTVLPRGHDDKRPVFAGWFTLNAAGEMTGTTWLEESGVITGPLLITNTHSVGVVRDGAIRWMVANGYADQWFLPVVAETYDGSLNDINGFHVTTEHARQALDRATGGRVAEGSVGGGTGMICSGFKGGIGTSSRLVEVSSERYTVGVLVQCNYGTRHDLRIAGVPVGAELAEVKLPCFEPDPRTKQSPSESKRCSPDDDHAGSTVGDGSIIVIVATDAPLLPHQLRRLAKRPSLGIARLGSVGSEGSGDIFIAFSTANRNAGGSGTLIEAVDQFPNSQLTPLFAATVQATEEAVVNALVAARTMTGVNNFKVYGLPHEDVVRLLRKYGRLNDARAAATNAESQ